MRIIKAGNPKPKEYKQTCLCGCVFAFTREDIMPIPRDYIICPTCKMYITPNFNNPITDNEHE